MRRKPTLTIGIPAFNEADNIVELLGDIKQQKLSSSKLVEVVVLSDGSTDATNKLVRELTWPKVKLMAFRTRKGKAYRLTELFKKTTTDMVIILDADIRLLDEECLEKVSAPVAQGKADLTSARVEEVLANTFVQKALQASMTFKKVVFAKYKNGNNIYTCHGRCRAFSQALYSRLRIKDASSEDAFSYLFALEQGLNYQYVNKAVVYYQLPHTFEDHQKQSLRFIKSRQKLEERFGAEVVAKAFSLPRNLFLQTLFMQFLKQPVDIAGYIGLMVIIKALSLLQDINYDTWSIANSSKKVGLPN